MSAAASRSRRAATTTGRERLRRRGRQLDQAMADGRIPALLVAIITGLLLCAFLLTDDYRVETVSVDGVQYGDAGEVVTVAGMLDRSAFEVDLERTAARIAALPYVEWVTVDLRYPGRATISIQERRPEIVVIENGQSSLVASSGMIFADGEVEGLPQLLVHLPDGGQGEALPTELVAAVKAIAGVYGPSVELVWNQNFGLAMERPDERLVIFGEPVEIEAKLTVLGAIEDQVDDEWTQLDLRVPTRPAYR